MDKLNFEFFDFFGAVLPGVPAFIIICFLITNTPYSYDAIHDFIKNSSATESIVIIFLAYAIGFCFHYPAYETFQLLVKQWGVKRTKGLDISIGKRENELVTIRQKSPDNFKLISKFLALRQMAYSMMFSFFFFFILLTVLTIINWNWNREIVFTIIFSLIFCFLFLRRAVAFHQRVQEMITEAVAIC
jgi:hypothetical protein